MSWAAVAVIYNGSVLGRIVLPCVALLGCRTVFGIHDPELTDGSVDSNDADANCGTADWDGDGLPDGCDPCPMTANNADTDHDGVGDACDPYPATPGETRVAWIPFESMSTIAGWTSTGGTWTVVDGSLEQTDPSATGRLEIPGAQQDVYVQAEMQALEYGLSPQLGLCAYVGPTGFRCCDVEQPGDELLLAWNEVSTVTTAWSGTIDLTKPFVMTDKATATTHDCTVSQNGQTASGMVLGENQAAGAVVVHVREVTAAYRYIWIVHTSK
jgi:hypothetical protein